MAALTKDRQTRSKTTVRAHEYKVAAGVKIYIGALVALNSSGYLVPASDTAGLRVVGHADQNVDNTNGANGEEVCRVREGVFAYANHATANMKIGQADIGRLAFVADDQTVSNGRDSKGVVAGRVLGIDGDEVWLAVPAEVEELGVETVTTGAVSQHVRTTLLSVHGRRPFTLADGLYDGQRKSIRVIAATNTPAGILTPDTFADGTSITLDAVNESVELEWHENGGWRVVHIVGATIS